MYINLANIDFGGEGGGKAVLQETTIESLLTETTKVITPPEGVDGFNKVTVTHAPVETLTEATITSNGETTITPSAGFDATFGVKVNVDVTTPTEVFTDIDGMKYLGSTITKFPDGLKFAPRTGGNAEQIFSSTKLSEVPDMNFEGVNSLRSAYANSDSIKSIKLTSSPKLNNTSYMFSGCKALINVDLFDTSGVTTMSYMFNFCSSIASIPHFNTSRVTRMTGMFEKCSKLTNIPLLDTSKVTDMEGMFSGCKSLMSIPAIDTSSVTTMYEAFAYCESLVEIPKLDLSKTGSVGGAFVLNCTSLTTLGGFTGLKVSINLSYSPLLTHDSLLNVINEAADVTSSPKTLTIGATNLAKLTDEDKAIATSKGWTLA